MISGKLESATAKQPWLRPSTPDPPITRGFTYQAPCTTIARDSALLLVGSNPSRRIEWP